MGEYAQRCKTRAGACRDVAADVRQRLPGQTTTEFTHSVSSVFDC